MASTMPSRSARTSLKTFIASITHSVWPALDALPGGDERRPRRACGLQVDDAEQRRTAAARRRRLLGMPGSGRDRRGPSRRCDDGRRPDRSAGVLSAVYQAQCPAVLAEPHLGEVRRRHCGDECLDLLRFHARPPGSSHEDTCSQREGIDGTRAAPRRIVCASIRVSYDSGGAAMSSRGEELPGRAATSSQQDLLDRLRRLRQRQVVGLAQRQRRLDRPGSTMRHAMHRTTPPLRAPSTPAGWSHPSPRRSRRSACWPIRSRPPRAAPDRAGAGFIDHPAHDVVGPRQVQVHLAQLAQRHLLGRRGRLRGPTRNNCSCSSGRNDSPCTATVPPYSTAEVHAPVHDELGQRACRRSH